MTVAGGATRHYHGRPTKAHRILPITVAIAWSAAFALYLLLAGQVSAGEAATGAVLASLAVLWAGAVRGHAWRRLAFSRGHVRPWLRTLAGLVPATVRTGMALARVAALGGSPAKSIQHRFVRGEEDAPRDRGRRATALLAASLAPDSFVLRAEPSRDVVTLHAIVPAADDPDPHWLQ